jgi:hypothetical protein
MARKMFNFRLEEHLVERVDRVAPKGKRTEFVEDAIEAALAKHEGARPGGYQCPLARTADCDFTAASPYARCPVHARQVVEAGTLL